MPYKSREKQNEATRKWREKKGPDHHRRWRLPKIYGITLEQYNVILHNQNNCCALCGVPEKSDVRGFHLAVDHDHDTQEVRGLLCYPCNKILTQKRGLAFFEKVVEYLTTRPVMDRRVES